MRPRRELLRALRREERLRELSLGCADLAVKILTDEATDEELILLGQILFTYIPHRHLRPIASISEEYWGMFLPESEDEPE